MENCIELYQRPGSQLQLMTDINKDTIILSLGLSKEASDEAVVMISPKDNQRDAPLRLQNVPWLVH